jgi:hypothetical protein
MQSTNQKCNSLACIIGLFCHSTSAPELVVEMLAHAGLSISLTAIHDMISSLSTKAHERLRSLSQNLTASFVYDNFDMDFKSWMPTVEKPGSTLTHATSAFAFPLAHGVVSNDLKCSAMLWQNEPNNPNVEDHARRPRYSWIHALRAIHCPYIPATLDPLEANTVLGRPTCTISPIVARIAWHFRHALVTFSAPFKHFQSHLGTPDSVLQIPVTQTTQVPCRAMDINQSTNDGQAQILESLLAQANLGDPTDNPGVIMLF